MDFTQHAAYFQGTQQFPQHFMPLHGTPLTPSHSNSAGSEDFNTTSPPDVYDHQFASGGGGISHDGLPHEGFAAFDGFSAPFSHQQNNAFPGPPTPPNPQLVPGARSLSNPQIGLGAGAVPDGFSLTKQELEDQAQSRRQGSNSEEDDLTPAQSRRKAQNRAAQRAFRERKERHVKDLEAKLAALEAQSQQTMTENERLKREMQKVNTENEILRATASLHGAGGNSPGSNGHHTPLTAGPMSYNPKDFYTNVLENHENKTPSHRIVTSEAGEKLLAAGATWDLIINHDLFKRGLVDVADVSERLKSQAKCDGQGPVFEERAILEAIEQSVASGSDELL
ncbi:Fluconazole resistance protein 3 [Coniochaeta hoffmannii]|uniref:Fluconazole resistance protein 3 n=1 Tax=Coniochaeta hoffmannii TaxID=91930 RepID=A0AA38R1S8_9PEZI|nr:Fluconazole resistance protein 3 [Coniochaeta hoffmannii]